jgi:murein DD-endopeptidase MepM/ murein hydrolase activator NlpD
MVAVAPVPSGHVGGGYGPRPCHSRRGETCVHAGWDFVGAMGDPVLAAEDGTVVRIFRNENLRSPMAGYGNVVVLEHEDGTWSSYNHLRSITATLGQRVRAGDQIGEVGNTTNRRYFIAPHLHFEVRHAKPDGSIPFPGAYGRFNLDPRDWFEAHGLVASNVPGTLTVVGLGSYPIPVERPSNEHYEPAYIRRASIIEGWERIALGVLIFKVGFRLGTGEWFNPFRRPNRSAGVGAWDMARRRMRAPVAPIAPDPDPFPHLSDRDLVQRAIDIAVEAAREAATAFQRVDDARWLAGRIREGKEDLGPADVQLRCHGSYQHLAHAIRLVKQVRAITRSDRWPRVLRAMPNDPWLIGRVDTVSEKLTEAVNDIRWAIEDLDESKECDRWDGGTV